MPLHTLLTDMIDSQGESDLLVRLLNRLGVCSSFDTLSRFVQYKVSDSDRKGGQEYFDCDGFTVVPADNIDFLHSYATVFKGSQNSSGHGTSIQAVQPLPSLSESEEFESQLSATSQKTLQAQPSAPSQTTLHAQPSAPSQTTLQAQPSAPSQTTLQEQPCACSQTTLQAQPSAPSQTTLQEPSACSQATLQEEPSAPSQTTLQEQFCARSQTTLQEQPCARSQTTLQAQPSAPSQTTLQEPSARSQTTLQEPCTRSQTTLQEQPSAQFQSYDILLQSTFQETEDTLLRPPGDSHEETTAYDGIGSERVTNQIAPTYVPIMYHHTISRKRHERSSPISSPFKTTRSPVPNVRRRVRTGTEKTNRFGLVSEDFRGENVFKSTRYSRVNLELSDFCVNANELEEWYEIHEKLNTYLYLHTETIFKLARLFHIVRSNSYREV